MTDNLTVTTTQPTTKKPRVRWGWWLAVALLAAFMGMILLALYRAQMGQVSNGPAPDFTLNLFDGGAFSLSAQRGKVVMVDFWASWCIPCRQEASSLEALWQEYKQRGVMFVGVAYVDTDADSRAFLEEFHITYPNGPDLGTRISQAYRIRGVPEKFFVDKHGNLRGLLIGPPAEATLRQQIEALLAEP